MVVVLKLSPLTTPASPGACGFLCSSQTCPNQTLWGSAQWSALTSPLRRAGADSGLRTTVLQGVVWEKGLTVAESGVATDNAIHTTLSAGHAQMGKMEMGKNKAH